MSPLLAPISLHGNGPGNRSLIDWFYLQQVSKGKHDVCPQSVFLWHYLSGSVLLICLRIRLVQQKGRTSLCCLSHRRWTSRTQIQSFPCNRHMLASPHLWRMWYTGTWSLHFTAGRAPSSCVGAGVLQVQPTCLCPHVGIKPLPSLGPLPSSAPWLLPPVGYHPPLLPLQMISQVSQFSSPLVSLVP